MLLLKRIALLTLLFAAPALAWGPVTHQVFGCRLTGDGSSVCFATAKGRSFVLGSSAPDAFKFYLPSGRALHNLDFAAFQLRFAERNPAAATPAFDALAYSHGFGAHLAQDSVGHQSDGYLPVGVSVGVSVKKDHLHEAAMDTFLSGTLPGGYESQRFSAFGDGAIDFSTAAIRAYGKQKGNSHFAAISREAVSKAMQSFDSLEAWERVASAVNLPYRREMVVLDPYGAADFDEAHANLKRAAACGHTAALVWREIIAVPETTGPAARKALEKKVKALFAKGQCQPEAKQEASQRSSP